MAYCTLADMVERFGQAEIIKLTDRDKPYTNAIVEPVLQSAIADASELIDSYLNGRYPLPLSPVPKPVVRYCAELARYYLYTQKPPEEVSERYKAAIKWLESVAKGTIKLGASDLTPESPKPGSPRFTGASRTFRRDSLKGM